MEIIGYIASLFIGISLGLIGGGGSILTVPVLVYLFNVSPVLATAYSLFIVGATSLVGVFPKYRSHMVNLKTAIIFGIPSIVSVYATRKWLVPAIPEEVFSIGSLVVTKPLLLMLLFAVLMTAASISMIRNKTEESEENNNAPLRFNYPLILIEGLVVGMLTGLVGAGGGFLIIPALVVLSKLPIKQAIGTSLLIIAMKSLFGFIGDLSHTVIDWPFLLLVTGLAIGGFFLGNVLNKKINAASLKKGFGWFVLVMGVYILIKELFFA
jgi:hypothetical protein